MIGVLLLVKIVYKGTEKTHILVILINCMYNDYVSKSFHSISKNKKIIKNNHYRTHDKLNSSSFGTYL